MIPIGFLVRIRGGHGDVTLGMNLCHSELWSLHRAMGGQPCPGSGRSVLLYDLEKPLLSLSACSVRNNGMPTVSFPRCFAEACQDTRPSAFSFRTIVENLLIPQAFS